MRGARCGCVNASLSPPPRPPFTASQLAQMINEKPQVVNEYEQGKAIPNPQAR